MDAHTKTEQTADLRNELTFTRQTVCLEPWMADVAEATYARLCRAGTGTPTFTLAGTGHNPVGECQPTSYVLISLSPSGSVENAPGASIPVVARSFHTFARTERTPFWRRAG